MSTTECSCRLCFSPGMYAVTSWPPERRTRAILRSAEFGFFGVWVLTAVQTPRRWGEPFRAGVLLFLATFLRPLRSSWLTVGRTITPSLLFSRPYKRGYGFGPRTLGFPTSFAAPIRQHTTNWPWTHRCGPRANLLSLAVPRYGAQAPGRRPGRSWRGHSRHRRGGARSHGSPGPGGAGPGPWPLRGVRGRRRCAGSGAIVAALVGRRAGEPVAHRQPRLPRRRRLHQDHPRGRGVELAQRRVQPAGVPGRVGRQRPPRPRETGRRRAPRQHRRARQGSGPGEQLVGGHQARGRRRRVVALEATRRAGRRGARLARQQRPP